jgi:hypothetical protein
MFVGTLLHVFEWEPFTPVALRPGFAVRQNEPSLFDKLKETRNKPGSIDCIRCYYTLIGKSPPLREEDTSGCNVEKGHLEQDAIASLSRDSWNE